MKALTLTQPWATLVAIGMKKVETRSWATPYRGPVAIHAAKGFPKSAQAFAAEERALGRLPSRVPLGVVIAVVRLVDIRRTENFAMEISALERRFGDYSSGRWAWVLEDVNLFSEPIPAIGHLGLWEWTQPTTKGAA